MEVHWHYALGAVVVIVVLIIFCKRLYDDNVRLALTDDAHREERAADADAEAGEGSDGAEGGSGKRKKVRFA